MMALCTIIFGILLVVPTAYWVRLKLPALRPVIEFITLLPLVIPAIVIGIMWSQIYDPFVNAKVARKIFADAGNSWRPWGCRNA